MNRPRPPSLPRRARLLALGWLLLAGQLMALLHPLAHGAPASGVAHGPIGHEHRDAHLDAQRAAQLDPHAHAPSDAQGPAQADAACDLCLACAAAGHGAAAASWALPAPDRTASATAHCSEPQAPRLAVAHWRNRGPPATA